MVEEGFATTLAPVVELNPVEGVQLNVEAPEAVIGAAVPLHTVALVAKIAGNGLTVTTAVTVPEQDPVAPLIVYVVLTLGFATTLAPDVELTPVEGDQV